MKPIGLVSYQTGHSGPSMVVELGSFYVLLYQM